MKVQSEIRGRVILPLVPLLIIAGLGYSSLALGVPPDQITLRTEPPPSGVAPSPSNTGHSVAVNDRWILLGQPGKDEIDINVGGVQVHRARDGEYVTSLLPQSHAEANQFFGISVALCGDIALVGAPGESSDSGAVYLFDLKTGNELARIVSPDIGGDFGRSIAVSQHWAVVGAPGAVSDRGAAYAFDIKVATAGPLPFLVALSPPGGAAGDEFGQSVAIYDELVLVGAPGDDAGKGSAFLFDLQGNPIEQLADTAGVAGDGFGYSVALNGSLAAVGAPGVNSSVGEVLMFEVRAGRGLRGRLFPIRAILGSEFGVGLAMSDDLVFVNNYQDQTLDVFTLDGEESGRVYSTFEFIGSAGFGFAIAVDGNRLLIGDPSQSGGEGFALYLPNFAGEPGGAQLIATGDSVPAVANARLGRIGEGVLGTGGLAYSASLVGKGSSQGRNKAMFLGTRDLAGQRANPDSTDFMLMLSLEKPNATGGGVYYEGRAVGSGRQVIYYDPFNGALNIFGEGKAIFPLGGEVVQSFGRRVHSQSFGWATPVQMRRVAGSGVNALNDGFLLHLNANGLVDGFVREGTPAPVLVGGELIGQIPRVVFADVELVYPCFLGGSVPRENLALYRRAAASANTALIARKGVTMAPNFANTTFGAFLGETSGPVVASALFRATLNRGPNVTAQSNEGLYSESAFGLVEVIRKGDSLLAPGVKLSRIMQFWAIQEIGAIADSTQLFTVKLSGVGVNPSNDCALFYRDETTNVRLLLREGDPLPGTCNDERVGRILRVEADPFTGNYAVIVSVAGAARQNNQALLMGNCTNRSLALGGLAARRPFVVLRKGRSHQQFFGGTARIVSVSFAGPSPDRSGAGGGGLPQTMAQYGTLLRVSYDSGKTVLVLLGS